MRDIEGQLFNARSTESALVGSIEKSTKIVNDNKIRVAEIREKITALER